MVRLYWYRNNFGDELSPYIISKLSGEKVVYRKPYSNSNFIKDILRFVKSLLLKRTINKSILMYSPFHKVLISIGSILEEATNNTIVWGAGIGSRYVNIRGGEFAAVRGPFSQERLKELNFIAPQAIGDPAILLPLIYPVIQQKTAKNKIGIIPHIVDFNQIKEVFSHTNIRNISIIDLSSCDIEGTIEEITSCNWVLSSSLHGLIVSHAYNIPAIWFVQNDLAGDGVKFADYFRSVNIQEYSPIIITEDLFSQEGINVLFQKLKNHSLPNLDLKKIQASLLKSAPFNILPIYGRNF